MSEYYGIFDDRDDDIRTKTPFLVQLPFVMEREYGWTVYKEMMDYHPDDLCDRNSD